MGRIEIREHNCIMFVSLYGGWSPGMIGRGVYLCALCTVVYLWWTMMGACYAGDRTRSGSVWFALFVQTPFFGLTVWSMQ